MTVEGEPPPPPPNFALEKSVHWTKNHFEFWETKVVRAGAHIHIPLHWDSGTDRDRGAAVVKEGTTANWEDYAGLTCVGLTWCSTVGIGSLPPAPPPPPNTRALGEQQFFRLHTGADNTFPALWVCVVPWFTVVCCAICFRRLIYADARIFCLFFTDGEWSTAFYPAFVVWL